MPDELRNFLFTVVDYIIPIESGYILITGKNFEGEERSRLVAGTSFVIEAGLTFTVVGKGFYKAGKGVLKAGKNTASAIEKSIKTLKITKNIGNVIKYGKDFSAKLIKSNLSKIKKNIAEESYKILNDKKFQQIIEAYHKKTSVGVTINGRYITFDEGPFSGITNFAEGGFHIGTEAFSSEKELIKTVLHEMYRLNTSKLRGVTGTASEVAKETKEAFNFAEEAIILFE